MRYFILMIFLLISCTSASKKSCPCTKDGDSSKKNEGKKETQVIKPDSDLGIETETQDTREASPQQISRTQLHSYKAWKDQLERNCRYSTIPSQLISQCEENNVAYDLKSPENEELYYFELMQSKNSTDRRKAYSYFQSNCSAKAPFLEFLEEKNESGELEEWERKEISDSIGLCKSSIKPEKIVNYNETGFYFRPEQSIGNGDFYFHKQSKVSEPTSLNYRIESENAEIIMPEEKKDFSYTLPAGSTLDAKQPALIVGNREIKLRIIENSLSGTNEYNVSGYLHSAEKGFSPSYWTNKKKFPVFYFSKLKTAMLKASVYKRSSYELINSQIMDFSSQKDDLYLYKADIDLKGYSGEVDVEVEQVIVSEIRD